MNGKAFKHLTTILVICLLVSACAPAAAPTAAPTTAPTAAPVEVKPAATAEPVCGGRPAGVPCPGESPTLDGIYKRGVFRAGYAMSPPYAGVNPQTGAIEGIGPDLAQELATRLGVELVNIGTGWDAIVQGIPAGKYDAVMTGLAYRPQRAEVIDYVILGELGACVIARADDNRINSFDDLKTNHDLKLGLTTGISFESMIQTDYPEINLVSIPNTGGYLWEDLLAKRIDATINDALALREKGESVAPGKFKLVPADCEKHPLFGYKYGHGFPKGDTAFLNWVQTQVDELTASGWYDQMYSRWITNFVASLATPTPTP